MANNRSMEVSIDTYCRRRQASKSANRYLSQAIIGLLLEKDPIDGLLTWNLLSGVYGVYRGFAFCTHSSVYSSKQRSVVQRQHGWSSCLLLYRRFFRHQLWTLSDFGLMLRRQLRRVGLCDRLIVAVYRNKNRNPANNCRLPQRTYTTYRYLSSDNIEWWKVFRYPSSQTIGLVKGISTPIVRNKEFHIAVSIVYRPNRHALEIPIDSYLFQR